MTTTEPVAPTRLPAPLATRHRLRIALIATATHPIRQPFAGGLEALVWQLAARLRRRGHDVTLFAGEGSDGVDPEYAFPTGGWLPSTTAVGDRSMPSALFMSEHHAYLRLLIALAGPLADRFDVIHNHSLHHLPVAMAPLLPVPMLTTLHTPPTPWLESALCAAPYPTGPFAAVSAFVARQWRAFRMAAPPVVIANGVDLARWPAGPGGEDLVWFGRIVPEKAPHLAIRAARSAGMRIVLAGPVEDRRYFEERVRPRLGADAAYAGHLTTPDLADLVGRSALALVTPVWDEPYGLVVAEALACGTPVVAFARGGVPEVLTDRSAGRIVTPGDVVAMAAAVPEAMSLDRAAVRGYAREHLDLDRTVTRYEQHYLRLRSGSTWAAERPA